MATYAERKEAVARGEVGFRRSRLSAAERLELRSLLSKLDDAQIARHFDITISTVRDYRRKAGISFYVPLVQEDVQPHPDSFVGNLAKRLGYATIEPALADLLDAYEKGKRAYALWGELAVCPFIKDFAQAWKAGYEAMKSGVPGEPFK